MCTFSLIPLADGGVRVVFTRDEQRTRAAGLGPRLVYGRTAPGGRAVLPVDPVSGGTWIAANDAGLILCLMNVTGPGPYPEPGGQVAGRCGPALSRGTIIPGLMHLGSMEQIEQALAGRSLADMPPFRLVAVDAEQVRTWVWRGSQGRLEAERALPAGQALCIGTSGLGDELVHGPRVELFEQMLRRGGCTPQTQDAFHRHRWADRPEWSVSMARTDARSVSRTSVARRAGLVCMEYVNLADDGTDVGDPVRVELGLHSAACA